MAPLSLVLQRTRKPQAPKGFRTCSGCGLVGEGSDYRQVFGRGYMCSACREARGVEGPAVAPTKVGACPGGAHRWEVVSVKGGESGTCSSCGATKFWPARPWRVF